MLRLLGAVLLVSLVTGTPAHGQQHTQFVVQATVPARVTLATVEQPTRLSLTEDDVVRGYKDVSARYQVVSNSSRGWLLHLSPRLGVTAHVEVYGLSAPIVLQRGKRRGVSAAGERATEPRAGLPLHARTRCPAGQLRAAHPPVGHAALTPGVRTSA
jgi:hypothetical protein